MKKYKVLFENYKYPYEYKTLPTKTINDWVYFLEVWMGFYYLKFKNDYKDDYLFDLESITDFTSNARKALAKFNFKINKNNEREWSGEKNKNGDFEFVNITSSKVMFLEFKQFVPKYLDFIKKYK